MERTITAMVSCFFRRSFFVALTVSAAGIAAADKDDENAQGTWSKPAADGKAWKHAGTGLAFPQLIGSYRLAGEFRYHTGGGVFIRYESTEDRARADIFFFPHPVKPASVQDARAIINTELDAVISNFQAMANQGRYKNVVLDQPADGEIPLWPDGSAPLTVRSLVATKVADTSEGRKEAQVKQWTGVTLFGGHVITIRYMHPTDTGQRGETALQNFAGAIFQVIKDPALRAEMRQMIAAYLADPLSPRGEQAASVVLAYIQKTPFVPAPIPPQPLTSWIAHFKQQSPGSEAHLLRAFVMGSAQAGLNESDPDTCLTAGAKQFLLVYDELIKQNPALKLAQVDELAAAVNKGDAAAYLKNKSRGR